MTDYTYTPSPKELEALMRIAADQQLSLDGVVRQAVRWYELLHTRLKAGETFSFTGDAQRARDFAGPDVSPGATL